MCPCDLDAFRAGDWDQVNPAILEQFDRNVYDTFGEYTDNMLFTRVDLDRWIIVKDGPNEGYSELTKQILESGGGKIGESNLDSVNGRVPTTVTTY